MNGVLLSETRKWGCFSLWIFVLIGWFSSIVIFSVTFCTGKSRFTISGWDERHYYIYARSLVIDGDLDFSNEYEYLYGNPAVGDSPDLTTELTPTGLRPNRYPSGMGVILAPMLLLGHLATWLLNKGFSLKFSYDGWSPAYLFSYCVGSITVGWFGIAAVGKALLKHFEIKFVLLVLICMFLGTNLFYYVILKPDMAHSVAVGLAGIYTYFLLKRNGDSSIRALGLGFLNGLMGWVRYTDVLIGIMFIAEEIASVVGRFKSSSDLEFFKRVRQWLFYCSGMGLGVFPLLIIWKIIHGSFWVNTYRGFGFNWLQPALLQVWFSTRNSLFFYSPLVLVALAGLVLMGFMGQRNFSIGALMLFLVLSYVNAAWWCWWFGASFGARAMLVCWPTWTIGFSNFLSFVYQKRAEFPRGVILVYGLINVCILWTLCWAFLFHLGFISREEGIGWSDLLRILHLTS